MESTTKLELTSDEYTYLYDGLSFLLDGLDESDDRYEIYTSILDKM